ncbi:MAG TPA: tRNA adenosine deaminase-associated protein [Mycobacteriales bacterium]|nr:tRNA adenosine deaminase-associated protein [Mycobacteriales bacterium]
MSYFAAALTRTQVGWDGTELDLGAVEDLDGLTDLLREVAGDPPAQTTLMFVEEDDEWLGIVRIDGEGDPRVFISDNRVIEVSGLARILYEEAAPIEPAEEEADEEESIKPAADPTGDVELLADLGTASAKLLELCAEEGQLPADITTALCERAGCVEQLERVREG